MSKAKASIPAPPASGLAGALMTLVAVAATAAAVPAPIVSGMSGSECRTAVMESQPVKAVAAVVAAACDLLGIERSSDTAATPLSAAEFVELPQRPPMVQPLTDIHSPAPPLRETLLNLPPPVC